jgi:diacylglycerol kinase (ATP)
LEEHIVHQGGVVIYNPTAGRNRAGQHWKAAQAHLGSAYEWIPTQKAGHAVELAREAAKTSRVVVAYGGDGTVGDVVRGIYGTEALLGIIPVGTGNDTARNLKLKLDIEESCATVLAGIARPIDIGLVNGVPFINNMGTGFDSRVMQTMNSGVRFARGKIAFNIAILQTIFSFPSFHMTLTVDDGEPRKFKAMMLSVLNGQVYGGGMIAAPQAEMDDGMMDMLLIREVSKAQRLRILTLVQSGKHIGHPAIELVRARKIKVETYPPLPINMDGDLRGVTPFELEVVPRALKVLVR